MYTASSTYIADLVVKAVCRLSHGCFFEGVVSAEEVSSVGGGWRRNIKKVWESLDTCIENDGLLTVKYKVSTGPADMLCGIWFMASLRCEPGGQ